LAAVTLPRPLSATDDRSRFDCGRDSLNAWFHQKAWINSVTGVSRTNLICDAESGEIVGFVTLSAGQVERAFLAKAHQRNKPDPIPITLLGQLAVRRDRQGEGHAASLLLFALRTALRASREIGSLGVLTHPIDDTVRGFYRRWGFEDLPFDPRRAMMIRMVDLEKSGIAA
jgi:GNAT superfamily N-acetyltransferase